MAQRIVLVELITLVLVVYLVVEPLVGQGVELKTEPFPFGGQHDTF